MLIKHSFFYLIARGIPAFVNFLAMAIYTRILSPDEYGKYSLVIAGVSVANATIFQWLRLSLLRFFPAYENNKNVFLSTIISIYLVLALLATVITIFFKILISSIVINKLIVLGLFLLWAQAFYEINLELVRIQLKPKIYGIISVIKVVVSLIIGGLLAYKGFGAVGLIAGLIVGMVMSLSWEINEWKSIRFRLYDIKIFRELFRYGLPMSATFILGFVINSSDRFLLGYYLGAGDTGKYSAGYDIAKQALGVIMMIVNLAAYPLAVRALEEHGKKSAQNQLSRNATVLLTIAIPCTAGFIILSPNIVSIFLGIAFRDTAIILIPWIAIATLLSGVKSYHFDLSFQLGQRTISQVWISLVAASINVILNLLWIPSLGLLGAAYSTVIAYAIGLILSIFIGRKIFELPFPIHEFGKIIIATLCMSIGLLPFLRHNGVLMLTFQVLIGAFIFLFITFILNFAKTKYIFLRFLTKYKSRI